MISIEALIPLNVDPAKGWDSHNTILFPLNERYYYRERTDHFSEKVMVR